MTTNVTELHDLVPLIEGVKTAAAERFSKTDDRLRGLAAEVLELQQKGAGISYNSATFGGRNEHELKELFDRELDGVRRNLVKSAALELPRGALQMKAAIVNATGQNQPLVAADRLSMVIAPKQRRLTLRDLIPVVATDSNLIEYTKETSYTNNASIVYASPSYENVVKPESAFTFSLMTAAVATLAHWIPASRQVLSDSGMLMEYLDQRLTYGLKLVEQDEILNGDGSAGHLAGLLGQATAYAGSGAVSGDQALDTIRRAMGQLEANEYSASAIVLNPVDWQKIELLKTTQGEYVFGDPAKAAQPTLWGVPVVSTNQIAPTRFLVGDMQQAAMLFDREQAFMRVAEQHADFFVRNMIALLVEERLGMAVFRPQALIRGNFN